MPSVALDICKLALSHLGDSGNITSIASPTTPTEIHCSRFYQIAVDEVFKHPFKFAVRKVALVERTDQDLNVNGEWAFAYDYPDCGEGEIIRVWRILPQGAPKNYPGQDFKIYTAKSDDDEVINLILTNVEDAYADVVIAIDEITAWPSSVALAVSYRLASFLANPIIKGKTGVALTAAMDALYEKFNARAKTLDGVQEQISDTYKTHRPLWISNR